MSIFGMTPHQMKIGFKATSVEYFSAITLEKDSNPKYEVILSGCNHRYIWDARKIATGVIETRFDIETGTKPDYYLCPKCADPRENGVTDFCMESVLHKVLSARKLTPLEERSVSLQR
jgi:hypothetical protein